MILHAARRVLPRKFNRTEVEKMAITIGHCFQGTGEVDPENLEQSTEQIIQRYKGMSVLDLWRQKLLQLPKPRDVDAADLLAQQFGQLSLSTSAYKHICYGVENEPQAPTQAYGKVLPQVIRTLLQNGVKEFTCLYPAITVITHSTELDNMKESVEALLFIAKKCNARIHFPTNHFIACPLQDKNAKHAYDGLMNDCHDAAEETMRYSESQIMLGFSMDPYKGWKDVIAQAGIGKVDPVFCLVSGEVGTSIKEQFLPSDSVVSTGVPTCKLTPPGVLRAIGKYALARAYSAEEEPKKRKAM